MAPLGKLREWSGSLGVRVAALLSVALLPIGLIAVLQTAQVDTVAREREELTYLAMTERAAAREGRLVERAIGVASALAALVPSFRDDPQRCREVFGPLTDGDGDYVFAGYVEASGRMTCSHTDREADFSDAPGFRAFARDPARTVVANPRGSVSGQAVVIVSEPVLTADGAFDGFVSVSLRHEALQVRPQARPENGVADPRPAGLVTFNAAGDVLSGAGPDGALASTMPADIALAALVGSGPRVFEAEDRGGVMRVYALAPILPDTVFALGSWNRSTFDYARGLPVWLFPILMWAISLAVAFFAVHWLVIRHLRRIIRAMESFAGHRDIPVPLPDTPSEIGAIERQLVQLADRVVRDEADAASRIHEQKVMMKEIHHRVKNNLQLIISLINMQMRQIRSREARFVLGRVRDRVLSLATIHRNLFEGHEVTGIAADVVVRQIADHILTTSDRQGRVAVRLDLDPIRLYPDQAVPLSLFLAEVFTNALKYHGGGPEEGPAELRVMMHMNDGDVCLWVENDVEPGAAPRLGGEGTGLGQSLIDAFAHQLGGRVRIDREDGIYRVALLFPPAKFREPAGAGETAAGAEPANDGARGGPDGGLRQAG